MQIFSKLHFSLCILLNINKIQWCNLLHCKTWPFTLQDMAFRGMKDHLSFSHNKRTNPDRPQHERPSGINDRRTSGHLAYGFTACDRHAPMSAGRNKKRACHRFNPTIRNEHAD